MIFIFGQVDFHLSYYYRRFVKHKKFMIENIVKRYIDFINELKCNNCNKIVFSVFPSPLRDENVFGALIVYKVLSIDDINSISQSDKNKVSSFAFRFNLYSKFNTLLEKYCKLYNINFISFDDHLLDNNKKVKSKFIDPISKYNIHLLWEPLIPIILDKILFCKISQKFKTNLETSLEEFIERKKEEVSKRINTNIEKPIKSISNH